MLQAILSTLERIAAWPWCVDVHATPLENKRINNRPSLPLRKHWVQTGRRNS